MAIELDIIPNLAGPVRWNEVKSLIKRTAGGVNSLLVAMDLCDLKTKQPVDDSAPLVCPGYYFCKSSGISTMSIVLEPISRGDEDRCYISDFGRNLSVFWFTVNWRINKGELVTDWGWGSLAV